MIALPVSPGPDWVAIFAGDVVEAPADLSGRRVIGNFAAGVSLGNAAGAAAVTRIRIPAGFAHPELIQSVPLRTGPAALRGQLPSQLHRIGAQIDLCAFVHHLDGGSGHDLRAQ